MVADAETEYHLFDRVVNIRESFTVPLGLRGTVIGIKGGKRDLKFYFINRCKRAEVMNWGKSAKETPAPTHSCRSRYCMT